MNKKIGMVLLIAFSLLSSARLLTQSLNFRGVVIGNDETSRFMRHYENRFAELKKMLYGEKTVGYSTDKALADYHLTQYAIAPIVIDKEKCDGYSIGSFSSDQSAATAHDGKLSVIKNFGNGVMLFKAAAKLK